jgi:hypothetical protein
VITSASELLQVTINRTYHRDGECRTWSAAVWISIDPNQFKLTEFMKIEKQTQHGTAGRNLCFVDCSPTIKDTVKRISISKHYLLKARIKTKAK